jgi:hypothetical protein
MMPSPAVSVPAEALKVLDGIELTGRANVDDGVVVANITAAIRRGAPQCWRQAPTHDRICLVGGGPSLEATLPELVALHHAGAKIVALNGAAAWLLARNLRPSMHVLLDARAENAQFVTDPIPSCRYALASQCAPALWDAVDGRDVWVWHALTESGAERPVLDEYYLGAWEGVGGGTTVATRAIALLRMLGYVRFDLFGIDSCWMGTQHHAYPQALNDGDKRYAVAVTPTADPSCTRVFHCAPWHLKQFEDVLQWVRVNGHQVLLAVHGDGLIAHALATSAELSIREE